MTSAAATSNGGSGRPVGAGTLVDLACLWRVQRNRWSQADWAMLSCLFV